MNGVVDPQLVRSLTWLAGLVWPGHEVCAPRPDDDTVDAVAFRAGRREWLVVSAAAPTTTGRLRRVLRRSGARSFDPARTLRRWMDDRPCHGVRLVPSRAASPPPPLLVHLATVLDVPELVAVIRVGTPRPHDKPVLHLLDPDARTIGYAKVGWNSVTRGLLANEISWLTCDAVRDMRRVAAPEVLHRETWQGLEIAILAALGRRPAGSRRDPPVAAFHEVSHLLGREMRSLGSLPLWTALQRRTADPKWRGAVDTTVARHAELAVMVGAWHGDWVRQNGWTRGGTTRLWDWEFAEAGVPVGFDVVHRSFQGQVWRDGLAPRRALERTARRCEPALRSLGLTAVARSAICDLYPLVLADRYLTHAAGAPLPPRVESMLDDLVRPVDVQVGT